MASKKRKKRKATAAQLRALAKGRKALKAKRAKKRKAPKKRKTPKRRVKRRAAPKRQKRQKRKLRRLSPAHLAKMKAGRKRARERAMREGPVLRAEIGESARQPWQRPSMGRHPIRNPRIGHYWKLVIHKGKRVNELIGRGPRVKAEKEAQSIMRKIGASMVELFGPYRTEAQALAA